MRSVIIIGVIAIGLAMATPSRAADLSPLTGTWIAGDFACQALDRHFGGPFMKIELPRIEFTESSCVIEDASQNGSQYQLELSCAGEGYTWRTSSDVTLTSNDRLRRDGYQFVRCY